jgi:hypothetical protein
MRFGFDAEQLHLRDALAAMLAKECDQALLRAAWEAGGPSPARGLWKALAEMGVVGLVAPEEAGGSDAGEVTLALALAEAGRAAAPLPLVETAAIAVPLLAASGDPKGVLPDVVAGRLMVTAAAGDGLLAPAAVTAELFLILEPGGARLLERDEVVVEAVASVDRTRELGRVSPRAAGTALDTRDGPEPAELGALATSAQLIGLGQEMVRTTVEYVKGRHQFGAPIGSFQAVKHHLADAWTALEFAAPAVWYAAYALQNRQGDMSRAVSMAKAMASDAARLAARKALQCHGAMGYTEEYHLHMWMKRAWALAPTYGTATEHRERIARDLGI